MTDRTYCRSKPTKTLESGHFLVLWLQQVARHHRQCSAMVATYMRAEAPRPEPDIERPGLAADIDGRRDIANAILADQSGADHGERRKGTSRRGYYRAQFETAWARYCAEGVTPSQPIHTSATVERHRFRRRDAVTAGKRQGRHSPAISGVPHVCGGGTRRETASKIGGLRRALDIRLRPWAFRHGIGLLPRRFCCATSPVVTRAPCNQRTGKWPPSRVFVGFNRPSLAPVCAPDNQFRSRLLALAVLSRRHPGDCHFAGVDPEAAVGDMLVIHDPGHFAIRSDRSGMIQKAPTRPLPGGSI